MGRIFFIFVLFFFAGVRLVSADTITRQITVTASVLPSPEWISLVQTHSVIHRVNLPFVNFVIYQILLTDGNILIKNHPVTVTASAPDRVISQTLPTNQSGLVQFLLPDNFSLSGQPDYNFSYFP